MINFFSVELNPFYLCTYVVFAMRAKNLTLNSVFVLKKKKLFIAHVLPTKPKKLNFGRSFQKFSTIQYF